MNSVARTDQDNMPPAGTPLGQVIVASNSFALPVSGYGGRNTDYAREGNPTVAALEAQLRRLEGCEQAIAFSCGQAALFAVLMTCLKRGDSVIAQTGMYGSSIRLLEFLSERLEFRLVWEDFSSPHRMPTIEQYRPKLVLLESPSNPLLNVVDIAAVAQRCRMSGALLCVDNTIATGALQQPLDLGADVSLMSLGKHVDGYSMHMGGAAMLNDLGLAESIDRMKELLGLTLQASQAAALSAHSESLSLRIERQSESAHTLAQYLSQHALIEKVYYPFLDGHGNRDVALRQMRLGSSLVSFLPRLKGESLDTFIRLVHPTFVCAHGFGSTRSLISIPARMSHADVSEAQRTIAGIEPHLVRLSIGIEDVEQLVRAIDQALYHAHDADSAAHSTSATLH